MVPLLRVIPQWSHQMNFMKISSKMEKGTSLKWSHQASLWEKDLGSKLAKVSLGHERGFKILPDNDAKMLSHKL
jgi:hypothetical protein